MISSLRIMKIQASSRVGELYPYALTEQDVNASPEHRSLAKTELSQKFPKIVDLIFISCAGNCGEENFRWLY